MRFYCFIVAFLFSSIAIIGQSQDKVSFVRESIYGSPNDMSLPEWTRMMYSEKPNVGEVVKSYEAYYRSNPFTKNEHTQYYKRWLRNTREVVNPQGFIDPISKSEKDKIDGERLRNRENNSGNRAVVTTPNWLPIGPFDFDKDAAGRSHAPGAAHVYTLEKAPSNPDVVYCGTANAGIWKSIDRGLNWTYVSSTIPVNYCNALEIHPTDPNTVWIGGNNRVYKTTNGGTSWTQIGNAAFNALSHSIDDISLKPGTTDILFVASNKGLFRSVDSGSNFVKLLSPKGNDSYFGEIEFKPNDPNTVYALLNEVNGVYTELYKSIDGGNTFSVLSTWPVLASSQNYQYQYIDKTSATNQYATFTNDNLGTTSVPNFTIEMRVKFPTSSADKAFLSNKNWNSGTNNGWVLGSRYTGELTFNISNGTTRIDLHSTGIWDDLWHQISVVYRASGLKELYIDGVLKTTSTSNITMNTNTGLPMVLGRDGNLNFGGLDLQVDEYRIWNTALASTEINSWRNIEVNNTHANYANLLHYYKCNEASGNTLLDFIGTNNGNMNTAWTRSSSTWSVTTTNLPVGDHQKRAEIAVTAANPEKIYALMSGSAYGGTGLFGFYESTNSGTTWTHKCCGSGPGGSASASNPNILGYSSSGTENGGQYYYDLALDADPNNANKVHIAGINPWISLNAGTTFSNVGHWSNPAGVGYVHADVHNIKIYGNEVWTMSDGGIFMSQDSGKVTFNRRQFGISGTDFWGFGMGHKDGDVMLGGTYHNSHLMKNNNVYINGWVSYTGSADGTRGFVNPGKDKVVYNDGGKDLLPALRTINPTSSSFAYRPNTDPVSKIIWDPRSYNCLYSGKDSLLWYSATDGGSWNMVHNFAPYFVGDIEIAWDNPNIMWVTGVDPDGFYDPKKIWKSIDKGLTWVDVTPSSTTLGYNADMWYNITIGDNNQHVWMNVYHRYGWNSGNNNKIFYSSNGGTSWTNITSSVLNDQNIEDVTYQRGSNGGIYVGTNKSVYYRDHTLGSFVTFATGLPLSIGTTRLPIWYKEGKIRLASNQSVWESPLYKVAPPIAQPMVDKLSTECARDTFFFGDYSAQYKKDASYLWQITPAPEYISSAAIDRPRVVFGTAGLYTISLTVTDSVGTSTKELAGGISVLNTGCALDTIPGKNMLASSNGQYAFQDKAMNISTNSMTLSAWIKPSVTPTDISGLVFCRGTNTLATGMHLTSSNELRYHWLDGQYGYSSGLTVPTNEWSHVALVVTPTQAKLYLNGKEAINTSSHSVANILHPFYIGVDPTSSNRTFKGRVDEVCIYNRALSKTEIRELMHLTKNPVLDASLKAYYQFNVDNIAKDYDKVGNNHLTLTSGTTKVPSTAPVGKGLSQTIAITNGGLKNFNTPGVKMYFKSTSSTYPAGDVVVSRINQLPDAYPVGGILPKAYWAINNYGTNQTFTVLDSVTFVNSGNISAGCTPIMYEMHRRVFNGEGATWGSIQDVAERFDPNPVSEVVFKTDNNVTTFGQFFIRNDNKSSTDPEFCNGIDDNCNGLIDETYSLNVTSTADSGVNSLRQILACAQNNDVVLFASNVDTITLLSPIVISKNINLLDQTGNKVALKMNLSAVGFTGAQAGITITATSTSILENIVVVHTNNTIAKPAMLNHGNLTMKDCALIGNPRTVILHSPSSTYNVISVVEVK
jgi:photosystem II stability/assembly factor-like uncharacterized protein